VTVLDLIVTRIFKTTSNNTHDNGFDNKSATNVTVINTIACYMQSLDPICF
jgi:hypothetical protein